MIVILENLPRIIPCKRVDLYIFSHEGEEYLYTHVGKWVCLSAFIRAEVLRKNKRGQWVISKPEPWEPEAVEVPQVHHSLIQRMGEPAISLLERRFKIRYKKEILELADIMFAQAGPDDRHKIAKFKAWFILNAYEIGNRRMYTDKGEEMLPRIRIHVAGKVQYNGRYRTVKYWNRRPYILIEGVRWFLPDEYI